MIYRSLKQSALLPLHYSRMLVYTRMSFLKTRMGQIKARFGYTIYEIRGASAGACLGCKT